MKVLEEIKVSVYENVYSKKPKVMSFLEVIIMCIHPVYATIINTIRRYYADGDHAAAQKLKNQLPCFTPAGTFNGAHAIKHFLLPSHIVGLDYDHVKNRLEVIQRCAADPHTVAAIESPTDGVKIFAYVEDIEGRHREGQQLVSRYYNQLLGLESDPACKDESRLCYFSYSPNGYIASLYQAFTLEPLMRKEENSSSGNEKLPPFPLQNNPTENTSEDEINKFISSYIFLHPLTTGQRHSNVFKLACEACRRHYPQESILRGLTVFFEHTDFRAEELTSVLSSGYKQVNNQTSATVPPAYSPCQKDIRTKVPYGTLENSDSTEEAYWLGEEFRKETPLFPRDLYNNLPDLLNDCIIEDASDREQDISLLSDLTALSAALPQTFGIYNHKKYSTHLFVLSFLLPVVAKALLKPDAIYWKKYRPKYCLPVNPCKKTTIQRTTLGKQNVSKKGKKEIHIPKNLKDLLSRCYSSPPLPVIPACKFRCRTTVRREASFSIRKRKHSPQPIIWIVGTSTICSAKLLSTKTLILPIKPTVSVRFISVILN